MMNLGSLLTIVWANCLLYLRNVTTEADYVSATGRNWVCADTAVSRPSPAIGTFLSIVQNVAMADMQLKAIVLAE